MSIKVIVLGAGLAGLSAAWKLSEKGVNVVVLESKPYVGGLAHTIRRDGFIFDYGPHRLHSANPAILSEARSILGDQLEDRYRKTTVYFLNKYFDYPLTAANLVSSLPPTLAITSFFDFVATRARNRLRPRPDDSFENWVINRFGRRLYDAYFGPYTAKVWGRDPSKLSASWAAQRVAVVDLWDLLRRVLGLKRGANEFEHSPYLIDFHYPRQGIGSLSEAMAERIVDKGGTIQLESTVSEIRRQDNQVTSVIYQSGEKEHVTESDFLVSSIPITQLSQMIQPDFGPEAIQATKALKYRALIFLFLMLDKEKVTDDNWIYFPDKNTVFNRVSEMKNFTPNAAPPGKTSLCVEISCDVGDELWQASEAELYEHSVDSLEKARLLKRNEIIGHFFERSATGYPTYDISYEVNLGNLAYHLTKLTNLVTCGRQGLFRYLNMDQCMEMGFCAAEEIISQEIGAKVTRVGTEQVYLG